MKVYNERDLAKALHENVDIIEIDRNLANSVIKTQSVSTAKWCIVIGCISATIPIVTATIISGGIVTPATAPLAVAALAPATSILGLKELFFLVKTAVWSIKLGNKAAGILAINKMRNYKMETENNRVILLRK